MFDNDKDVTIVIKDQIQENIHRNFVPNYEISNYSMKETG